MHFKNIEKIATPKIIKHKGNEFFLCLVRQKFIQVKSEEIVRQKIVSYLIEKFKYPLENIDIEVPISYFKSRQKGRADIIIYNKPLNHKDKQPIILIECKAREVIIKDLESQKIIFHFEQQLNDYNKIIKAKYTVLTNGSDFIITDTDKNKRIECLPTFEELISGKEINIIKIKEWEWKKTHHSKIFNKEIHKEFITNNFISPGTKKTYIPYIIKLMDLFYDDKQQMLPVEFDSFSVVKDCGLRFANYGYAFYNGLIGHYRFFLIRQSDGNHQIVSFSIYHQDTLGTYLMVAVDNRKGHSLELCLDRYLDIKNNTFDIWHSGTMAVGNKGRLKNSEVINYVKTYAPGLVINNKILLGKNLPFEKDLTFELKDVKDFFVRTATYAVLRDKLRYEKS